MLKSRPPGSAKPADVPPCATVKLADSILRENGYAIHLRPKDGKNLWMNLSTREVISEQSACRRILLRPNAPAIPTLGKAPNLKR